VGRSAERITAVQIMTMVMIMIMVMAAIVILVKTTVRERRLEP
jgi:hypothetical protein